MTVRRLRLLVGIRFQVSFTPLIGVLFTFPSRYWFTIGRQGVFRLGGWSPHVQTGFHVPRPTQGSPARYHIRDYHPLWPDFPDRSAHAQKTTGLLRFRSPLLPESRLMSVPPGTEMFQFPGFASAPYGFRCGYLIEVGCPIRTPRDQRLLAAPPRFSQRATSFVASWRQGIHQMPFSYSNPPAQSRAGKPRTGPIQPAVRDQRPAANCHPPTDRRSKTGSDHTHTHTYFSPGRTSSPRARRLGQQPGKNPRHRPRQLACERSVRLGRNRT